MVFNFEESTWLDKFSSGYYYKKTFHLRFIVGYPIRQFDIRIHINIPNDDGVGRVRTRQVSAIRTSKQIADAILKVLLEDFVHESNVCAPEWYFIDKHGTI